MCEYVGLRFVVSHGCYLLYVSCDVFLCIIEELMRVVIAWVSGVSITVLCCLKCGKAHNENTELICNDNFAIEF